MSLYYYVAKKLFVFDTIFEIVRQKSSNHGVILKNHGVILRNHGVILKNHAMIPSFYSALYNFLLQSPEFFVAIDKKIPCKGEGNSGGTPSGQIAVKNTGSERVAQYTDDCITDPGGMSLSTLMTASSTLEGYRSVH